MQLAFLYMFTFSEKYWYSLICLIFLFIDYGYYEHSLRLNNYATKQKDGITLNDTVFLFKLILR